MSCSTVLVGVWPRRMPAELAAVYCGESSCKAFLKRVGSEYPQPRVKRGEPAAMAQRRSGSSYSSARAGVAARPCRGFITVRLKLPRYIIAKPLANGATGFYFNVPTRYREMGCEIPNEPLGDDYTVACGVDGTGGRAAALNGLFDEWWKIKNGEPVESIARYGTIDWLFREYKASKRYEKRVSARTGRTTSG